MSLRTHPALAAPGQAAAGRRAGPRDPLELLRAEHVRLLEKARHIEWLLNQKSLSEGEELELDAAMRVVRALLPAHLVREEQTLYDEILRAEPSLKPKLAELRRMHLVVEEDFSQLQGLVLALSVRAEGPTHRRRASRAARAFCEDLALLVTREEAEAFAAAKRGLAAEAMGRMGAALEAAASRDALKERQLR